MEVDFLNLFKKAVVASLVLAMTMTVGCGNNKNADTNSSDKKQKIEYITEITKDNVEEVVIEYKEILSYYNDLKNNLKTISDASKNPDLESDLVTAKDSIKNGQTLLASTDTKYKPLKEAKEILKKMYVKSLDMSDHVLTDSVKYKEELKDYDVLFKDFKEKMDKIRLDIEKVRGKSPKQKDDQPITDEVDKNKKTDLNADKKQEDSSNKNTNNDKSDDSSRRSSNKNNDEDRSERNSKPSNTSKPSRNESNQSNRNGSNSNQDQGFVPRVSSLNNSLRSEIRSAGANAGASFKQGGGNEAQLESAATQMFNDLEGDSPIQGSQLSEARAIFVEAFKAAFYGN